MKKQLVMTTAMAAGLLALPACSSNDEWKGDVYADREVAVCVNRDGERVRDDYCDDDRGVGGSNAFLWYYLGRSSAVPYYGDSVRHSRYRGSYTPSPNVAYGRAPASTSMTRSRAVSRGGFGSSARSFGGGRS